MFSSLGWSFIPNWHFCENESQAMLWSKYFVECLGFSPIDFYEESVLENLIYEHEIYYLILLLNNETFPMKAESVLNCIDRVYQIIL